MVFQIPFTYELEAIFQGYEPRGVSVRISGASGGTLEFPELASQVPFAMGDKILMHYEVRYQPSQKGQGYQASAKVGARLVNITKMVAEAAKPGVRA